MVVEPPIVVNSRQRTSPVEPLLIPGSVTFVMCGTTRWMVSGANRTMSPTTMFTVAGVNMKLAVMTFAAGVGGHATRRTIVGASGNASIAASRGRPSSSDRRPPATAFLPHPTTRQR